MRLHRLSLSAFGPFAGTVSVDLDDVARDGLFLLWGPTGAGKTTLLDAVVFALYGTVPGPRGHEKRLRSDHAEAAVRTEVECELSLGAERVRVVRRPEQTRPKKRGAGETTEPARLTVQRWTAEGWAPVSTRIDEGSEYLSTRLGLTAEQFCQVVLLPQGDFARFLRAEPEERGRLLGTLFDVGRFARAEEWLAAERRAADEALRGQRLTMSTLLARVAATAEVDVPEALAPELVGADPAARVNAWVAAVRARTEEELVRAAAEWERAAARSAAVERELAEGRALAALHTRRDRARAERDRLAAAEARLAPARSRRDAGRSAEAVRDVLEAADRATAGAATAGRQLSAARAAWTAEADGREPDTLLARTLRDEAAAVRALLPEAERAAERRRRLDRLEAEIGRLGRRCADGAAAVAAWPARVAAVRAELETAREALARVPALQAAVEGGRAGLAAAVAAERLTGRLPGVRAQVEAAREAWLAARERLLDVRTQRLNGMAAELAAGLADGAECPVCGSAEHPRPAAPAGPTVSVADEERAREAVDAAEERLSTGRAQLAELERELAVLRERAGDTPAAELRTRLAAAEAELARAEATAGPATALAEQLAAREAEGDARAAALAGDREQLRAREAERAAAEAALAELQERLEQARGDDRDLTDRLRRLTRVAERCEALLAAAAEDLRARAAADAARTVARARAEALGLPGPDAAAAALLPPGELAALDRAVEEHERAAAAVTRALADPELADLPPLPDVDALQRSCAEATAAREQAVAALERARRCAGALGALAGEVAAAEVRLDELRGRADQVGSLADLVTGRGANTLRMRLQSFVLAARLEQLAEVASRRLRDMSGGRYRFEHTDAQGRHGARGGLGLVVLDEHTGTRRPTKTLSGGESFMASLALALGLADVVTAENGGVQIDTLFIDEGFGTLDAQALDAVLTVLDELRRGGRTVGVISHVEELRLRIPSRLEVLSTRHGSLLAG